MYHSDNKDTLQFFHDDEIQKGDNVCSSIKVLVGLIDSRRQKEVRAISIGSRGCSQSIDEDKAYPSYSAVPISSRSQPGCG